MDSSRMTKKAAVLDPENYASARAHEAVDDIGYARFGDEWHEEYGHSLSKARAMGRQRGYEYEDGVHGAVSGPGVNRNLSQAQFRTRYNVAPSGQEARFEEG
jgi:hypothetical protein